MTACITPLRRRGGGGWWVHPIMIYLGRGPFQSSGILLSKGPGNLAITGAFYGCEKGEKMFWFCDLLMFKRQCNLPHLKGMKLHF